ncbi:MAG: MBL fold metallo-hydrolase [Deltaproteobacteria bacterium]|nr:MBL fold metallo-hydrolase [Deltaproteobacteria bacterium]
MKVTHYGTATVLFELDGLRILTDPVFDPSGTRHQFAPAFPSTKTYATPIEPSAIGDLDAILLSHDQHGDNLDAAGRELLASAARVVTTRAAKARLGQGDPRIVGLAPFESTRVEKGIAGLKVTATPARHGPPLSLPFVGSVVGFLLELADSTRVYVTGDTVLYGGVREVAARFEVDVAVVHMGCASWGPFRFTMNAREGEAFARAFPSARILPVHYEGWTHFKETRKDIERVFTAAGLADRLTWLEPGVALEI